MTEENTTQVINWDINKAAIAEVAEDFKDIDAYKDLDAAKKAKKTLVKMRTTLAEAHKETKAEALEFGRTVDAKKNEYLALILAIEDPIGDQLDEIKNAEAKKEEARIAVIIGYIERIQAFSLDRHSLTLAELEERLSGLRLIEIDPEAYEEYSEDAKLAKDEADLKLRLAIDRVMAEQKEQAEKDELERRNKELEVALEESRLANEERGRKQKEYDDQQAQVVRDAADKEAAEQKEKDDARQKELDEQQAEIDQQKKEADDKALAEAQELFDANEKQKAEELRDLQAPDVDKLSKYAEAIHHLIGLKPVMGSTAGNGALLEVLAAMITAHDMINDYIEEMK